MNIGRRLFLRAGVALVALTALPRTLLAAAWPESAFAATASSGALIDLFGSDTTAETNQIKLTAPDIAENGAVVPLKVSTTLENVESISIIVEKNPRPLAATIEIPPGTLPEFSSRIKMRETSDVMIAVKTNTGVFTTAKEIKVTIGGCGG